MQEKTKREVMESDAQAYKVSKNANNMDGEAAYSQQLMVKRFPSMVPLEIQISDLYFQFCFTGSTFAPCM